MIEVRVDRRKTLQELKELLVSHVMQPVNNFKVNIVTRVTRCNAILTRTKFSSAALQFLCFFLIKKEFKS